MCMMVLAVLVGVSSQLAIFALISVDRIFAHMWLCSIYVYIVLSQSALVFVNVTIIINIIIIKRSSSRARHFVIFIN